jgi:hypothetical protein
VHFNDAGYRAWTGVLKPVLMAGEAGSIHLPDFQNVDVGTVAAVGSSVVSSGMVTVDGSGAGTYGSLDGFHFAWSELTGNGQITARIATQTNTATNATAGVMLREQLTADSRYAFVFTTPGVGTGMTYRTAVGGISAPTVLQKPGITAPYWLRLVRNWAVITCYLSPNGITWTKCGSVKLVNLKQKVYIGLAVSSLADGVLGSASFDNVWIYSSTAALLPAADVTIPTIPRGVVATAVGVDQINVAWTASNDSGTGVAGYKVFRDGNPIPVGTTSTTAFVDSGLISNTLYTYTVSAYDAASPANESEQSGSASATTQAAPPP